MLARPFMAGARDERDRSQGELVRVRMQGEEVVVLRLTALHDALPASLPPAEREVVALALEGRSNAEIARRRGTAARTVANQLASIFRKLGVGSRAELARACARGPRQ